jgi:transcriptional regulator with XRE-family HTH domain
MTTALHKLRLERGQTLRELALDVGVSRDTLHRIERGQRTHVRPSTRAKLARTFGMSFEELTAPATTNGVPQDAAEFSVTTAKLSVEG